MKGMKRISSFPRSSVGMHPGTLQRPGLSAADAGASKTAFPRWSMGTIKDFEAPFIVFAVIPLIPFIPVKSL